MLIYTNGKFVDKDGYVRVNGMWDHPRANPAGQVYEHILVMEKKLGRPVTRKEKIHHISHDPSDNRPENLKLVTGREHHRLHKRHRNMEWGTTGRGGLIKFVPDKEELVSVEEAGKIDVYDIAMADPHNNFVANGIVVHNCGKTRAALVIPRKFHRMCIVAPKVTQGVWARECGLVYDGLEPVVLKGMEYEDLDPAVPIFWMNYEIVRYKWSWFNHNRLDLLVLDECQMIKSKHAQRTQAVHALCGCSKMVVGLTGTPIYNKPKDLWSLLWAVQAGEWPPYYEFARLYCDGRPSGYGGYIAEGFNRRRKRELQGRLQDVVHRVRWKDVSKVPKMDRHRVPVVLSESQRRRYDRLARDARKVLEGYEGSASPTKAAQLRRVTKLRSTVGQFKANHTAEFLLTVPPKERVVVWAHHHEVIEAIADKLVKAGEGVAQVHGRMSGKKQRQQLDYFKHKARFIIVSLEAGAVGIDLSVARLALFAELSWTPSIMAQAERRTWRNTQKRSCIMYYMLAQGTIEDRILDLLEKKVKLVYEAMDDAELLQLVGDVSPQREDILEGIIQAVAKERAVKYPR